MKVSFIHCLVSLLLQTVFVSYIAVCGTADPVRGREYGQFVHWPIRYSYSEHRRWLGVHVQRLCSAPGWHLLSELQLRRSAGNLP